MLGHRTEWSLYADRVGGTYKARNNGTGDGIRLAVSEGPWHIVYTRFRITQDATFTLHNVVTACFTAVGDFNFSVNSEGLLARAANLIGIHDIETGDAEFDAAFRVKSNDPGKAKELLDDPDLRRLFLTQPHMHVTVFDEEGLITRNFRTTADAIFGDAADQTVKQKAVREIYYHMAHDDLGFNQVVDLLDLFRSLLHRMVTIGAASEADPAIAG